MSEASELIVGDANHGEDVVLSQWMRRLFDHHHWRGDVLRNVSLECRQHVREYVTELKAGSSWATKSKSTFTRLIFTIV